MCKIIGSVSIYHPPVFCFIWLNRITTLEENTAYRKRITPYHINLIITQILQGLPFCVWVKGENFYEETGNI
jgi:hypothetical protein